MAVDIGQVIINGRIFLIQFQGFLELFGGAILIVMAEQEVAIGSIAAGMFWMPLDEIRIRFAHGPIARLDSLAQLAFCSSNLFFRPALLLDLSDPTLDISIGLLARVDNFLKFILNGGIRVCCRWPFRGTRPT